MPTREWSVSSLFFVINLDLPFFVIVLFFVTSVVVATAPAAETAPFAEVAFVVVAFRAYHLFILSCKPDLIFDCIKFAV
jgi:uncharacterized membrane protein